MSTVTIQSQHPVVDLNALRTNQALIVAFVVLAFVLGSAAGAWLILAAGVSLAIGAALPGYGPFQLFYRYVVRATGLIPAKPRPDDPAPHRFAQALGATVLIVAAGALFAEITPLGWVLAWSVAALALINLLFGFCAGCFLFYQLHRVGLGRRSQA
ncbi:MAG: hypothetical protein KatS3mg059_0593 [Thermomicrobiales bacterium]|nr:MAG: hypothetical protein KatS3mg059_0593 [Thermomicrobiales bacterium]